MKVFAGPRGFDVAWYPGVRAEEGNHINQLHEQYLFDAAQRLGGAGREQYLRDYPYALHPTTYDRPYFLPFSSSGRPYPRISSRVNKAACRCSSGVISCWWPRWGRR